MKEKSKPEFVDRFVDPNEKITLNKKRAARAIGVLLILAFFFGYALGAWLGWF